MPRVSVFKIHQDYIDIEHLIYLNMEAEHKSSGIPVDRDLYLSDSDFDTLINKYETKEDIINYRSDFGVYRLRRLKGEKKAQR